MPRCVRVSEFSSAHLRDDGPGACQRLRLDASEARHKPARRCYSRRRQRRKRRAQPRAATTMTSSAWWSKSRPTAATNSTRCELSLRPGRCIWRTSKLSCRCAGCAGFELRCRLGYGMRHALRARLRRVLGSVQRLYHHQPAVAGPPAAVRQHAVQVPRDSAGSPPAV